MPPLPPRSDRVRLGVFWLALVMLSVYALDPTARSALSIQNSDSVTSALVANEYRHGWFSAFYWEWPYGGTVFSYLRALATEVWSWFAPGAEGNVRAQLFFSYVISPFLYSAGIFALASCYLSRFGSVCAALFVVVGLHYTVMLGGWDTGYGYQLVGMAILMWRARLRNPWSELSHAKLFGAGALLGFAIYTHRSLQLYALAFFFVAPGAVRRFRELFVRPAPRFARALRGVAFSLLGLWLLIEVFGRDVGSWNGRPVRLDAKPNLVMALVLLSLLWAFFHRREWARPAPLKKAALLAGGFFLGLLPEMLESLRWGRPISGMGVGFSLERDIPTMLKVLGQVPKQLLELTAAGPGVARLATALLIAGAIVALVRGVRRDARLHPLLFLFVAATLAHIRIQIGPGDGNPRYLMPLLPALCVGVGLAFERLRTARGPVLFVAIALLAVHGIHHTRTHHEAARRADQDPRANEIREIAAEFAARKVPVVLTDDYWNSFVYTFALESRLRFTSFEILADPHALQIAKTSDRVGLLLKATAAPPAIVELGGMRWQAKWVKTVSAHALYDATRVW